MITVRLSFLDPLLHVTLFASTRALTPAITHLCYSFPAHDFFNYENRGIRKDATVVYDFNAKNMTVASK